MKPFLAAVSASRSPAKSTNIQDVTLIAQSIDYCMSDRTCDNGRKNPAPYAVHEHPSDYLLRGFLLSGRRVRVWLRGPDRFGQRGAVGNREFRFGAWMASQPAGSGRAIFCPDRLEHDAAAKTLSLKARFASARES